MQDQGQQVTNSSPAKQCGKKYANFFNAPERVPFPAPVDGDIDTKDFCRAVEGYVKFFESFGILFKPIIQDALFHLEVIRKFYSEHEAESKTLRSLLEAEKQKKEGKVALQLLWLTRGLRFYSTFLEMMLENARLPPTERKETSTVASLTYDMTLSNYHGFFTRNTIKLAYKTALYGKAINQRLWYASEDVDELVLYSDAMTYRGTLPAVVQAIDTIYEELKLDTSSRAP